MDGLTSGVGCDWVLVTGQPGSGKTTAVLSLVRALQERIREHSVEQLKAGLRLQGFVTEEVMKGGTRIGFDVVTIPDGRRGVLSRKGGRASLPKTGQYSVDVDSFERLALPTLCPEDDASTASSTVYVVDEIGRMELHSDKFKLSIQRLLAEGVRLVGAITAPIYGHRVAFCDAVSNTKGVEVHKLTKKVRDAVVASLTRDLTQRWAENPHTGTKRRRVGQ